jgi:serine/threonine protein phosphatase PrpC
MPEPADPSGPTAADGREDWLALTASQRGAAHDAMGLPNQDAVAVHQVSPGVLAVAVADGHGHHRHFRSARGSELAVAVTGPAAAGLAARLAELGTSAQVESAALGWLVPDLVSRWRDAVHDDLKARPFSAEESEHRFRGDDALIAYGSTLLLALAAPRWLVLVQIGDGDIVAIQPGGRALLPVPGDPSLDGRQTTSLCGPEAERDFRVAVLDTSATPLCGVLLATDGYGNAQAADPWADAVGADLAELISDRTPQWLAGQLPSWAARCASADGSADDTTVALLLAPQRPASPEAAAQTMDIPPVPAEPQAPAGPQTPVDGLIAASLPPPAGGAADPGDGGRPARRSRHLAVIGAAVLVIAAVATFLAVSLGSRSHPAPSPATSCAPSSAPAATGSGATRPATAASTARPVASGPQRPVAAASASCQPGPGR